MPEPFDTSRWRRLHPKVQTLWRLGNLVSTASLTLPVGLIAFLNIKLLKGPWWVAIAVAGAFFVIALAIGQSIVGKAYDRYRYELGDDDLGITKGVFWRSWRFISRNRVQHLDITAGPIARALGLVQVTVYVGGMHQAAATIPGLTEHEGELLRANLVTDRTKPPIGAAPEQADTPPPTC